MKKVALVGAAAVGDYIFEVDHLPEKGEIVTITGGRSEIIPGGCAPNIACGIANWGQAIPVLRYPVGKDFDELNIQKDWIKRGIICRLTQVDTVNSGCAWMYMQKDGTTMCFGYPGASDYAVPSPEDLEEEIVVIAPKLNAYTTAYLEKSIEQTRMVIVTGIGEAKLLPYLKDISVLIINQHEIRQLCKAGDFRDLNELMSCYPKLKLYVTYGSKGSMFCSNGTCFSIPIVNASIVRDFTGAGDAYTSGIVSALAAGLGDVQAGYIGACASSFTLEYMGGQTYKNDWQDLMNRLEEQHPHWQDVK